MSRNTLFAAMVMAVLAAVAYAADPPPPPTSDITASPSSVDFGSLTPGAAAVSNTVTLTNMGNAPIVINASFAADSAEFAIQNGNDLCSGQTIQPNDTCTLDIVFTPAPGSHGIKNAILNATAYPGETTVSVAITGVVNNPPVAATLVYPANEATGIPETFSFIWNNTSDPDGDAVSYMLYYGANSTLTGAPAGEGGMAPHVALMFFAVVIAGGLGGKRKVLMLVLVIALFSFLLLSCGSEGTVAVNIGDGTAPPSAGDNQTGHQVTGLPAGTTYYWKVVTVDSLGGMAESPTWSFTTS